MTSIGSCVLAVMNQPGSESECAGTATTRSTSRGWKANKAMGRCWTWRSNGDEAVCL